MYSDVKTEWTLNVKNQVISIIDGMFGTVEHSGEIFELALPIEFMEKELKNDSVLQIVSIVKQLSNINRAVENNRIDRLTQTGFILGLVDVINSFGSYIDEEAPYGRDDIIRAAVALKKLIIPFEKLIRESHRQEQLQAEAPLKKHIRAMQNISKEMLAQIDNGKKLPIIAEEMRCELSAVYRMLGLLK